MSPFQMIAPFLRTSSKMSTATGVRVASGTTESLNGVEELRPPRPKRACVRSKFGRIDVSRHHENDPGVIRRPFENRHAIHIKQLIVK